ncbi:hypothetical protein [Actinotalea solisilvae]|uniref:hypothetical protein n=1 Tax=Actinotalea solisilvae TaxID=2072922 RepID=UPI0018F1F521|nr:hypothetical protein [Actinotalea solisilvae]
MTEPIDRPTVAVSVPMSSGGMGASMGVAAPIGAVSRRVRERARRTALRRGTASSTVLVTAIPGTVALQRRAADGSWKTVRTRRAALLGRTRIDLPPDAGASPRPYRVVFAPRNPNLVPWISEDLGP